MNRSRRHPAGTAVVVTGADGRDVRGEYIRSALWADCHVVEVPSDDGAVQVMVTPSERMRAACTRP